ncbi:hypothetical protein AWB68_01687 [Caballeronia choica]|uniref:Uncharacterized protein n=1 Tax=Caballeronia choica TaxID=326476 RepID=A0A158H2N6_9BURK|nr:hypothetical protein [Caballeronia choica]SAL38564.1 hypothetical protein AWB68_01687 [Caballeronia choica]
MIHEIVNAALQANPNSSFLNRQSDKGRAALIEMEQINASRVIACGFLVTANCMFFVDKFYDELWVQRNARSEQTRRLVGYVIDGLKAYKEELKTLRAEIASAAEQYLTPLETLTEPHTPLHDEDAKALNSTRLIAIGFKVVMRSALLVDELSTQTKPFLEKAINADKHHGHSIMYHIDELRDQIQREQRRIVETACHYHLFPRERPRHKLTDASLDRVWSDLIAKTRPNSGVALGG